MYSLLLGLLCMPALVLQKSVLIQGIEVILFIFFVIAKKKYLKRGKVKLLPSLFITIGVIFFALLSPEGKVLFKIGSFPITLSSLELGLHKSFVLNGMVFISQLCVSKNVKVPGKFGTLISEMFLWFDILNTDKVSFNTKNIIKIIDKKLIDTYFNNSSQIITVNQSEQTQEDNTSIEEYRIQRAEKTTIITLLITVICMYITLIV